MVSVAFADLVGFTSHTEQSDPEDVRARLTAYHQRVREDIERFGGRVEKLMGDGVFSVFGAPTAHEDDPERAVRAALRVQESVAELSEKGLDLAVRIAVTTGEAMVQLDPTGTREGIVGDVVNTASRLEAVAPPGGVVVDQTTYLSARAAIDFDALDPVVVKGKAEPQVIWLAASARSRFGVAVEEHDLRPFVGRDRELAVLVDSFERVIAEQAIQLVTIVGSTRLSRTQRRSFVGTTPGEAVRSGRERRCTWSMRLRCRVTWQGRVGCSMGPSMPPVRLRIPRCSHQRWRLRLSPLHAAGETSKSRELAEEFKSVTEEALSWRAFFLHAFADPLVEAGHSDVLSELARKSWIFSEILESRNDATTARLAEHDGDAAAAVSLLQRSVSIADEFGVRVDGVQFRIQLARCLRHLGRDADAAERLDEARLAAESMGAGLLVSRIDDLAQSRTEAVEA